MNFYHMTDLQVLAMPSKRFWSLEAQIDRVRAELDFRQINVNRSTVDGDSMSEVVEKLSIDMGETVSVQRNAFVKAEPGAKQKFARLMGKR